MKQQRLPSFVEEQRRYALRFTCEHCTYFDVTLERCMHGYPNAEHRTSRYDAGSAQGESEVAESPDAQLIFCKEFELM